MTEQTKSTHTKSQDEAANIAALLRARNPLIWVVTREESRVEGYLAQAAASAGYVPRTWDIAQGVADMAGNLLDGNEDREAIGGRDPLATLEAIAERARAPFETSKENCKPNRGCWIMRDLPLWLQGAAMGQTLRTVRNLARLLPTTVRERAQALIVITPSSDVPLELQGHATVIDWPLPDRGEIGAILDAAINVLPDELKAAAAPNGQRELAIDAAVGLSGEETQSCFARSLVQTRKIDAVAVASEKKRVIAKERILEWYDPLPGGMDSVGGLDNLKVWLTARRSAFSAKARAYGLPAPKGALLIGIPGCGKSLTAKAIATAWQCPLLRYDFGALKSKFVGESESNQRKAYKIIETVGRCVIWIDEIEKGLQGATSGSSDGGVSANALGSFLSWMQERSGDAFVVATANDVSALPPELLRKGRFDEIFFVDLPNAVERLEILLAALRSHNRGSLFSDIAADVHLVVSACDGFTGSEIASLVPEAMFAAFADGERELTTDDLLAATRTVVPLARTSAEKINALRAWAKERARPATSAIVTRLEPRQQSTAHALDL